MKIKTSVSTETLSKCYVIPFASDCKYNVTISPIVDSTISALLNNRFSGEAGEIYTTTVIDNNEIIDIILWGTGDTSKLTNRKIYLSFAKVTKKMLDCKNDIASVMLDNAPELMTNNELMLKLLTAPFLVGYSFDIYKSTKTEKSEKTIVFVTNKDIAATLQEAEICGTSTNFARTLINHPSMHMTPTQLANDAKEALVPFGVEVEVYNKKQIQEFKMGCFLSVSKGAIEEPKVIVMRYMGDPDSKHITGLIGKGITFDSGGYSLKEKMASMHADMGGAGAVIGTMFAVAQMKLKANVVAVVAACENKIAPDAYVPGDVLFSMNGKTVEMLNADAEGRLTLVDSITYAIRHENVSNIIDIATLTGAAKGAVGNKAAPVLSNNEELFAAMQRASNSSCEKIWRLDLDEELAVNLNSNLADIKNSNPGSTMGGGTIMAALFIQNFVEDKPWVHIDMAAVNQVSDDPALCKGATGYGVNLLYSLVKDSIK